MTRLTKQVHPDHYQGDVEPIDLIVSLGIGPEVCVGNILKYVSRYKRKGGWKDLLKAKQYLDWLMELEKENYVTSEPVLSQVQGTDLQSGGSSGEGCRGDWTEEGGICHKRGSRIAEGRK
jgi:hypothetical protein